MQTLTKIKQVYYLVVSLFWLATALPLALLVLLFQARGLDLFQIGIVMGLYSLTIVLLEVPTGGLADAVGRKRVSLLAYSVILISAILLLGAFSFPAILLGFMLNGVGRALSSGTLDAWFIDALKAVDPDVEIQPALAQAETFTLLALSIGTLGGSLIPMFFAHLPAEGTAILTPLSMPVVTSTGVYLLLLLAVIFLVQENHLPDKKNSWLEGVREIRPMIQTAVGLTRQNNIIKLLLVITVASGFVLASLESFWPPHFSGLFGGSEQNTFWFGVILGGSFLAGVFGNMLVTPISNAMGKRYALVAGTFEGIRGIVIIGLALQTNLPIAVLLFWIVYLNMGITSSPYSTLLNDQIPSSQRSSILSIASLAFYLGGAIGGILLGFIAEQLSVGVAWVISGAILVIPFILYLRIEMIQKKGDMESDDKENDEDNENKEDRLLEPG